MFPPPLPGHPTGGQNHDEEGSMSETDGNEGMTTQVVEQAQELVGRAQEKAQRGAHQASETIAQRLREQVQTGSAQAAEQVRTYTTAMRRTADGLHADGQTGPARMTDGAVQRLDRLVSYLSETEPDRMLADVESFGRRRPWTMIAGGMALGFVASRFLKASSRGRMEQVYARSPGGPPIPPRGE